MPLSRFPWRRFWLLPSRASLIAAFLLLTACTSSAPVSSVPPSPTQSSAAAITAIDYFIATKVQQQQFSGTVLIAQGSRILLDKGYGWADEGQQLPNQPLTRFRIASITKQFTAMAILLLQEQGKLHVQDHICLYIAACPMTWQAITIQQLLTHTSGIPDYYDTFPQGQPVSPEQLIASFQSEPLDFAPGTRFEYSNSGYVILGSIIEHVAGESYAAFLEHAIFRPLHLEHTGYDQNAPPLPEHATGYAQPWVRAAYVDMSVPFAAGALYSTVNDLYHWDEALFTHSFASSASLMQMFTPQVTWCDGQGTLCTASECAAQENTCTSYGYGWFLYQEAVGQAYVLLIEHSGDIAGFVSSNRYYPDQKLTLIMLSNLETFNPHDISDFIESTFFSR